MKLLKLLSLIPLLISGGINKMNKSSRNDLNENYDIYPIVQHIVYEDTYLTLSEKVNIVINDDIDKYTLNKAYDVLSIKPIIASRNNKIDVNKTNLMLGLRSISDLAYQQVDEDLSYFDEKFDAYYLKINENNIIIIGKDSDAVYYGLSTLEYIFEQSEMNIRSLRIKDYAQSKYRGFIEGYYGIPWTDKERIELMHFGSKIKSNIYIYAPKDDVYHSTSWRSLYSENDYKIFKEQVKAGLESKTRLAWAIHPFMNKPITQETFVSDLETIKAKFEQVYEAGVRQFVLSADDINMYTPGTNIENIEYHATLHKNLLNELNSWIKGKSDCYELIFVPTTYNNTDDKCQEYFSYLMDGLSNDIQIMWTGEKVCSSMKNMAYDEFYSYSSSTKKPFIWMNWPVNDYAINYLLMGEGEVYNKYYQDDDEVEFIGVVTNPMQLSEASKISIFATGDYAWNTNKFDSHASYLASLKHIEEKETSSFLKIIEHLTNASLFEGEPFLEAESLKPLISNYKMAYESGDYLSQENEITAYLDDLVDAINSYLANASNRKLVKNILPWVEAVRYCALTAKEYLYLVRNEEALNDEELKLEYDKAILLEKNMLGQVAPNLIPGYYSIEDRPAYACKTVLSPFITYLKDLIIDDICIRLNIDTGITYYNLGTIYQGKLENINDNDEETYCWFNSSSSIGSYVRLDLLNPTLISDVKVIFGNSNPNSSDILYGDIEVSLDAKNWTKIGETSGNRNIVNIRDNPLLARFIRIISTKNDSHWVAIREISYNSIGEDLPLIRYSGFKGIYEGSLLNMVDGDDSTYCWFSSKPEVGGYIYFDFFNEFKIEDINIKFGTNKTTGENDKFTGILQYSIDGEEWFDIGLLNELEVTFDLRGSPISARYIRMFATEDVPGWVAVRELSFNQLDGYYYFLNSMVLEEGELDYLYDEDETSSVHFSKGENVDPYITLDLREEMKINNIIFKQGSVDYPDDIIYFFKVYISLDNVEFEQVGDELYKDTYSLNLDLSSSNINARYIKIASSGELLRWVAINTFTIIKGEN